MKKIILLFYLFSSIILIGQTPANDPHWELVWQDLFTSFDNTKWTKANFGTLNQEPQIYLTSNVYCQNDNLVLSMNNNPVTCPLNPVRTTWACGLANPGQTYSYNSGWVETSQSYNTQFGYIESRIKLPHGYGFWPAFWTFAGSGISASNVAEIDIFEMLGSKPPNIVGTNIHKDYCPSTNATCNALYDQLCPNDDPNILCYGQDLNIINFNYTDWHLYGIEWTPSKIIWYIDNLPVRTINNPGIIDPVRIILNFAIDPNTLPNQTTPFPSNMLVDHVKVYQLKNDCNTNLNVCNYNFGTHDNKVKKNITIGNGSCSNSLNIGQNIYLRASESVLINGEFTVPVGSNLYIDVNPCY